MPASRAAAIDTDLPMVDGVAVRRLLIVKLSALGDVVHALPVAVALRRRFPALRITWAVENRWAALLVAHPAVDRIVPFPRFAWGAVGWRWTADVRHALAALAAEPYDLTLDLQGLLKSAAVAFYSRAPLRLGAPLQREGAGLVSPPVSRPVAGGHAVDEYLACAARLGAEIEPVDFGLRVDAEAARSLSRTLAGYGVGRDTAPIVINPSASRAAKAWPMDRWRGLIDGLADRGPIVVIGAAEEARRHAELTRGVVDLIGRTTLQELVALLARSALHIAADTGSLHLAVALGRPVIGLYGPTPVERLGPFRRAASALHHRELCAPTCPRLCPSDRACLAALTVDEVVARARQLLQ